MPEAPDGIPVPRLQLRWEKGDRPEAYVCHYELVFRLRPYDVRLDGEDGRPSSEGGAAVVALGETRVMSGEAPWSRSDIRDRRPYRDGAHSTWDSEALRGLPIYVLAPDMDPALVPPPADPYTAHAGGAHG